QRGHGEPAALQVGRRAGTARTGLAGQRGHVGGVGTAFVTGGEHHQAVMVADEEAVLVGDLGGDVVPGPVQAAPGVVHDAHAARHQVLVDAADAQGAGHLVAAAGSVVVR